MADDYEKNTVVNLRAIFKDRGIATTGLTRKAQLIEKLREVDAGSQQKVDEPAEDAAEEVSEETPAESAPELEVDAPELRVVEDKPVEDVVAAVPEIPIETTPAPIEQPPSKNEKIEGSETRDFASLSPRGDRSISGLPVATTETDTEVQVPATQPMDPPTRTPSQADTDIDASKKRKRRSATPPMNTQELAIKKSKYLMDIHLPEDKSSSSIPVPNEKSNLENPRPADDEPTQPEKRIKLEKRSEELELDNKKPPVVESPPQTRSTPLTTAIHPATRALYIQNFMRPLQPTILRQHIISITGDSECIETLHLDSIRSHAFILFTSEQAADRVRSALHDEIWPKERDRLPLWVDYILVEKLGEFIEKEKSSDTGSRSGTKKWEVIYRTDDGKVETHLAEKGNNQPARPAPSGKQAIKDVQDSIRGTDVPKSKKPTEESFVQLGKLFSSTKAKPMLYWMPVDDKLVQKRTLEMKDATKKGWNRDWKDTDEMRKYTYEDGDHIVDAGPYLFKTRQPAEERANGSGRADGPSRYGGGGYRR